MTAYTRPLPAHEYVLPAARAEDPRAAALLACFRAPAGQVAPPRALVVGAHPDDETMGPGGMLPRFPDGALEVLHVTDGAPRQRRHWGRNEHATWDDYAAARRAEVLRALAVAGIAPERAHRLGVMDSEAAVDMAGLTLLLRDAFDRFRPEVVVTHPYEGGHTDHDAVAFAARSAVRLLERDGAPVTEVTLTPAERDRKRRMFDVYHTQHGVLRDMPVRFERYRPAPRYDFGAAPHAGRLRYELYPQGMQGKRWRALAMEALGKLRLPRFY